MVIFFIIFVNVILTNSIKNIAFEGNNLCLDFINSIHNRKVPEPKDYINDKASWLFWLQQTGLRPKEMDEKRTAFDLKKLTTFRHDMYQVFYKTIHDQPVSKHLISKLNRYLSILQSATQLSFLNGQLSEQILFDFDDLNLYQIPIFQAGYKLLISLDRNHIKECSNCGWLFLDISKNKKRRWCNMKTCGNEVKARKFYRKSKLKRK